EKYKSIVTLASSLLTKQGSGDEYGRLEAADWNRLGPGTKAPLYLFHTHTHTHTYTHTYTHSNTHTHTQTHSYCCMYIRTDAQNCTHTITLAYTWPVLLFSMYHSFVWQGRSE